MTTRIVRLIQVALLTTAVLPTKAVWGQTTSPRKLDETLQDVVDRGCTGTQSVIIRTKPGYRQGMRESLTAHGDGVAAEFMSINAVAAEVHCDDLETLASFDATESVSSNAEVQASAGVKRLAKKTAPKNAAKTLTRRQQAAAIALQHALRDEEGKQARALKTHFFETMGLAATSTGDVNLQGGQSLDLQTTLGVSGGTAGIGVAVIDSGIEPGPDFGERLTHFYDFTFGDVRAATPSDQYGHGTHVAGLVGSKYVGVAPAARLVGLKVLDGNGQGTTANVLHAIEFAVANKDLLNIQVLNLSLGHPIFESAATDPLVQVVEHAVRSGLVVVISAGNFGMNPKTGQPGYAGIASPGNAPSALTAGAVQTFDTAARSDDRVAPYSSRGPSWYDGFAKPDVVAPGHQMLSVAAAGSKLRTILEGRGNSGNYMKLNGTSMAAGVTSGMVALTLQANRGLTPNALKAVLQYTAVPVQTDPVVPVETLTPVAATTTVAVTDPAANAPVVGGLVSAADDNIVWGNVVPAPVPAPIVEIVPAIIYADALTQGAGGINGAGALTLAASIDPTVPVGSKWLLVGLDPVSVLGGETVAWSQRMLWGNHFAYGTGVIDENRVAWGLNIVWGDFFDDNIVWGNNDDNIVWGNLFDEGDNIVWGNNIVWANDDNIVWGNDDNIVWGNDDNIVWGNDDNIVWGNNIVWGDSLIGFSEGDNIVWGNLFDGDNIVWGNLDDDNIVWGNLYDDNIVWGNDDNIVWGNSLLWDVSIVNTKAIATRARRVARRAL